MSRTPEDLRILRLLVMGHRTQSELEASVGAARNTIRRALRQLVEDGLIEFFHTDDRRVGRGGPKGWYVLIGGDPEAPRVPLGTLRPGDLWVRAAGDADTMARMQDALAEQAELLHLATWVLELHGAERELLVAFDPAFGATPADALHRALRRIEGAVVTTGSVRDLNAADDFQAKVGHLSRV